MTITVRPEIKEELSGILKAFLLDIDYDIPPQLFNAEFPPRKLYPIVENEVKLHFKNQGFSDNFLAKAESQFQSSIEYATVIYQKSTFSVQCTVAIFGTYAFLIDDWARDPEFRNHLKQFNICLLAREPQGSPILQSLAEFISSLHSIFGQFAGDMIIKDTLQFISACYAEAEYEKIHFPVDAQLFPGYFRLKVGISECYAFMLFPFAHFSEAECQQYCLPMIPYWTLLLGWVNDIMSYYKEMVEMEKFNYITNSAKCQGMTEVEFLRKLCGDSSDMIRTLRKLSQADTRLSEVFEDQVSGYITFHLMQTRYRLADLDLASISDTNNVSEL